VQQRITGDKIFKEPVAKSEASGSRTKRMWQELRHDAARYAEVGGWWHSTGFWLGAIYRFGTWAHGLHSPFLRWPAWALYRLAKALYPGHNIYLWAGRDGARIGAGLCLIHPFNVVIGPGVEIGENCLIFHGVTLGCGVVPGRPKIGNRVDIYAGACVLGGVVIGDDVMIGANCVVTRDVPSRSIVSAASNRVLPRSLSPVARQADITEVSGG
jgi:serine O-acetyltransferase